MLKRFATPCLTSIFLLAGCASSPSDDIQNDRLIQEGLAGTGADRQPIPMINTPMASANALSSNTSQTNEHQIIRGNGALIAPRAVKAKPGKAAQAEAGTMFNFSSIPIQAVVNTILGDVLKANYSIAQGVTGT